MVVVIRKGRGVPVPGLWICGWFMCGVHELADKD